MWSYPFVEIAQRGGKYPIPGEIHSYAGWGSEQTDLAVGLPVQRRELN